MKQLDEFKTWLEADGFTISWNGLSSRDNLCNWFAYRRSRIHSRECEGNGGKLIQLVVKPFFYSFHGKDSVSAEVEVRGQSDDVCYKLDAYALSFDELQSKLPSIEKALIAAWNALA